MNNENNGIFNAVVIILWNAVFFGIIILLLVLGFPKLELPIDEKCLKKLCCCLFPIFASISIIVAYFFYKQTLLYDLEIRKMKIDENNKTPIENKIICGCCCNKNYPYYCNKNCPCCCKKK